MDIRPAMVFLCALLASCASSEQSGFITVTSQPANAGDAGIAALRYHDSGAYQRDLQIVANQAAGWIKARAASAQRPALVLDIDETALSNWEIIKRDDFGRPIAGPADLASAGPWGWAAWDQLGRDPAIQPALQVFRVARAANVAVFFISGRPESQRVATERNLRAVGFGDFAKLFLTTTAYCVPNNARRNGGGHSSTAYTRFGGRLRSSFLTAVGIQTWKAAGENVRSPPKRLRW